MICVSIGRGRHRHLIAEHRHLVEQGAPLVELRLDYIVRDVQLKRILRDRPGPVIITVRREKEGGRWEGDEQTRLMLLRTAIAEGVEYVDLEDDIAGSIPRFGKTKRIVSLHNFRETPQNLAEIHAQLAALDADIVKIATMAQTPHDNVRMLRLIRDAKIPTVGICMGDIGTPSRILAGRFGAPFTYATFHHERALAPGQLSFEQMLEVYHYDRINADTDVYGVIADPVGHSYSPLVHNAAFWGWDMNKVYVPFRVPGEHLDQFLKDCPELGVKGLSVTIPHKEDVLRSITRPDDSVIGIGAANTLVFQDGQVAGYNTDCDAALECIHMALGGEEKPTENLAEGKKVLILGAGGVARAIAYGLCSKKAEVIIASRTFRRAKELAEKMGCVSIEWAARHGARPDLIINCTPVGMHPNLDESPFTKRFLTPETIVFDTVYNPEQTLLIKEAREQGCQVITGVDMFVRQAARQFQLFTGLEGPTDVMRQELKRATGAAKP